MRDKLGSHLAALENANLINRWHDRQILAGDNWQDQIDHHLEDADLILLLIGNNFMASRYCYGKEMTRALERSEAGEAIVIPVLLRAVVWSQAPFAKLQCLPENGKPVMNFANSDKAYYSITEGIRQRVKDYWEAHPQKDQPKAAPPATIPVPKPQVGSETQMGEALQKAIATHPLNITKQMDEAPERISNPYDFEHPAKMFFRGRQQELSELTSHLAAGKSALVLGLQRMGKTSLVERALERLETEPTDGRRFVVIRIDMFADWSSFNTYMDFFLTIANRLADQVGNAPQNEKEERRIRDAYSEIARAAFDTERYEKFKSLLKSVIRSLNASLILFIDEFQEIERVFQRARERKVQQAFDAGLMRWIGSLAKDPTLPFQLMICGRHRALAIEERETLELFKTHHRIPLRALDEQAARQLIKDPVSPNISYQDEAVRTILELTGGLPYLIQLLCSHLMNTSRVRRSASIRKRDVDAIADDVLKDPASKVNLGLLYTDFKDMSNGLPWKALCALAQAADEPAQQVSLSDIAQQLKRLGSPTMPSDSVSGLMDELVTAGIVDETGKGRMRTYKIAPDLLRLWLRKRHIG
jgi:GTPase SAR1 family protein